MSFNLSQDEGQPDLRARVQKASARDLLECIALYEFDGNFIRAVAVVKAEIAIRQNRENTLFKWLAVFGGICGVLSLIVDIVK